VPPEYMTELVLSWEQTAVTCSIPGLASAAASRDAHRVYVLDEMNASTPALEQLVQALAVEQILINSCLIPGGQCGAAG